MTGLATKLVQMDTKLQLSQTDGLFTNYMYKEQIFQNYITLGKVALQLDHAWIR